MDKRLLITGAGGFIGTSVLNSLLDKDYEIIAGDCNTYLTPSKYYTRAVWDVLDQGSNIAIIDEYRPTHLIHLAWNVGENYLNNPENLTWMNSTITLVNSFFMNGGTRAICAGSCFEYDLTKQTQHFPDEALKPSSLYGVAKAYSYSALAAYLPQLNLAWARIFYPYGPLERHSRLIPSIINGLLTKGKAEVRSAGNLVRDFVYVQDVANTLISLLENDCIGPLNIVGDESSRCSIRTVCNTITDILDMDRECVTMGVAPTVGEPESIIGHGKFEWSKTNLVRGLVKTIKWWKENI